MYSTAYNLWTFTWFLHFELPFRLKGTDKIHTERFSKFPSNIYSILYGIWSVTPWKKGHLEIRLQSLQVFFSWFFGFKMAPPESEMLKYSKIVFQINLLLLYCEKHLFSQNIFKFYCKILYCKMEGNLQ